MFLDLAGISMSQLGANIAFCTFQIKSGNIRVIIATAE